MTAQFKWTCAARYAVYTLLILGVASSLAGITEVKAADLPSFQGDGRHTERPQLSQTFSLAPHIPDESGGSLTDLQTALDHQSKLVSDLSKKGASFTLDGIPHPVTAADLQEVIAALRAWAGSKRPLEQMVSAYQLQGDGRGNVRFTGYFTPSIRISAQRSERFPFPLYRKPRGDGPFPTRAEIYGGALAGKGLELAWTDNMVDLFFLEVQGSGYGVYPDGRRQLFSFGGKNGHPYASVGKHLVAQGTISAERISAGTIKAWMAANPQKVASTLAVNPSYVFFSTKTKAVSGAGGVPLTALRSVAADSSILPLGSMLLVEVPVLDKQGRVKGYRPQIMAVQDRGGAIKGPGRLDIYAGAGPEAENTVGHLKHFGRVWLLLPRE